MTETLEREWTHEGRPELTRRGVAMPDGPWVNEPDKRHWVDPATDLDCLMVRNSMGAWCGYVAVTEGHPYFGIDYGQCPEGCGDGYCSHSPEYTLDVHGGITYAAFCRESEDGEGHGICHTPLNGRPERVWWLGFDCNHYMDLSPYDAATGDRYLDGIYRDVAYVKAECASLAQQLKAVPA